MSLKPEVKVILKLAGIGSFWCRVAFIAYFQILSTIKRINFSSWYLLTTGQFCPLSWVSSLGCARFYNDLYVHYSTYIFSVESDFLQNVISHRRELLLSGILVIWTVVSLIASKLRLHLFPVLGFTFSRTFTNPQFCMTSACYMHNYLMKMWNVMQPKKLSVLWNGFSGAGNVNVSCLSQNSQERHAKSL
jgi:hypothetical protein